ncbi:DUF4114 domain-containing protein [Leptolyngbya cf. ectocarpi LEGE 11479]|uniref:DUF4114 domain-containing protein n=1 Tax=Leptolyngbya cf. ectocarpi LEGE 11479 TaxID=1828722 RepID=A0A928X2C2_LEPEC|nr:DUF4114 domain-containing protein [Leptolyngbya ectocarpi]MBE9066091.1 DUF4114 domain-containing protein [Leptolyngbya cf. ectocarpi LEGE 11479]
MKFINVLTSVCAAAVAITGLTQDAWAANLNRADYENQLGGKYGLSYDQWMLFNQLATNEERLAIEESALNPVSLDDVTWETGAENIEVFFVNDGAAVRGELFYSTDAGGSLETIWDDIASPNSLIPEADGLLSLGEGKQLGEFASGTILNVFLQADGNLYGIDSASNPDGEDHIAAYESGDFLLLGFEDRSGRLNDRDFNDVVIAIKGLTNSDPDATDVPEPMGVTAIIGMSMLGLVRLRRR